ncbi:uncharacterized protein LOC111410799 isoform X1 [Olea europaea var. sylvestris]|uniref:uncharacterized protein LOC111410799 isoform X1 n=1 Tax=Olea europaea var. sylvestris TaxID=158386 RepID=UPI000C1CE1CF|nr:uncharacterized protein LOC111410799 isoform X1 [Olea europaea var. sylvestris]
MIGGVSGVVGGRVYWVRSQDSSSIEVLKIKGIVVIFTWISSITESQLKDFVSIYSSLGWNSLVCLSDFLNPFIPERATSLAFSVLNELVKELRSSICPVVLAASSGGSKACMYKFFQIIGGCCEAELNLEDNRLVMHCISGQIYDSDPVDFSSDLGARLALNHTILKMPGFAKLVSFFAKGVTSSLDALFLTRFGSQRVEYWQTLCSSVDLGVPFLILCSENDDVAPYPVVCKFARQLRDMGGDVNMVKLNTGQHKHHSIQYTTSIAELLEQAISNFSHKIQKLGERTPVDDLHDEVSDIICDLQNAAVDSNQSLRRVAVGPNDHFFLPSSAGYVNRRDSGSVPEERKERSPNRSHPCINAHSVLGQVLFDVCVPKNVEGWDIKFAGSLNAKPLASVRKRLPFNATKHRSRL